MLNNLIYLFVIFVCRFIEISSKENTCSIETFWIKTSQPFSVPNDYCYGFDDERPQIKMFSTITAYRTATKLYRQSPDDFHISNCTASNAFLIIRHGTRLPSSKKITAFSQAEQFRDKIISNIGKLLKSPLCEHDVKLLKQWKWNQKITTEQALDLTSEGYAELRSIAQNYRKSIPSIFNRTYDPNEFSFRYTTRKRTKDSFQAFVEGLFGENAHQQIDAEPPSNGPDLLLRAHSHCDVWNNVKDSLKNPESETKKFENSFIFLDMIKDVDSRLGFNDSLKLKELELVYEICRYEQAWKINVTSPWCSLLTPSQIRIFEYREDLKYFYKSSHGSKINKIIPCAIIQNLFAQFKSNLPKVTAYFTHSAVIQQMLTALDALKDEQPLKADNLNQMFTRKWKTSSICPFAANIAVIKYDCPNETKVKFFLNEQILKLDWCSTNGVCDWNQMNEKYKHYQTAQCEMAYCKR